MSHDPNSVRVAFGTFEADLSTGELWRGGFRIKLQGQPFRVLVELVQHPGQVITRDELQQRVWDKGTNVDFDHSLGTAINKIREALGDNADNPRYVETLTRRGYRFIAPVRVLDAVLVAPVALPDSSWPDTPATAPIDVAAGRDVPQARMLPSAVPGIALGIVGLGWKVWLSMGTFAVAASLLSFYMGRSQRTLEVPVIRQLTHTQRILPGGDAMESFPVTVTDGLHLFASVVRDATVHIERIAVAGGESEPIVLPDEVAGPAIADISHDGARLLVRSHASNQSEQPLFMCRPVEVLPSG